MGCLEQGRLNLVERQKGKRKDKKMKKCLLTVLFLQGFVFQVAAEENFNDDKYYVRKEAPPFEIPAYKGEHYEDLVPCTLDLAEMARLAINGLTGPADPDAGYELWFEAWWTRYPPILRHEMSLDCQAKFLGPLVLMRMITGSEEHLDIEKKIIQSWLRTLDDQGMRHKPQRRWVLENVWAEDRAEQREPMGPYDEGETLSGPSSRFLEAMMLYYMRDKNPLWTDIMEKNFKSMLGDFKEGDELQPREYEFSGEKDAHGSGWSIQVVLQYYRMTGKEIYRKYAKMEIDKTRNNRGYFGPGGQFLFDPKFQPERGGAQSHWHCNDLLAFMEYARATGDRELVDWVKMSYEWFMTISSRTLGFFPEMATPYHPNSEGCTISDMVALSIWLAQAGAGDQYWDDAERILQNHFAESQLTRTQGDYLERSAFKSDRVPVAYNESTDHVTERSIGAFAGWPTPNDWICKRGIQHCCTGNCARVIYYAWQSILDFNKEQQELRINLLLNRASPWADVYSHIPYQGQVDIKIKQPCQKIVMRAPEWIPTNSPDLLCTVNGKARTVRWEGRFMNLGEGQAKDKFSVTFPIAERTVHEIIAGTYYSIILKGNTVVGIDPPGRRGPLYQRDHYRGGRTLWHSVDRFVSDETVRW
jgi:hypothetical protein